MKRDFKTYTKDLPEWSYEWYAGLTTDQQLLANVAIASSLLLILFVIVSKLVRCLCCRLKPTVETGKKDQ